MRSPLKLSAVVLLCLTGFSANAVASYDKPYVGEQKIYIAKHEDTLVHIARYFDLGFVEMRAANPTVDPWIPGEDTKMVLPSRHILPDATHEGIVINLPEMRLYAFVNGDDAPTTFPIGIGREGLETPLGQTSVVRKKEGPIWRPTPRMLKQDPTLKPEVGPGPDNPMGTHALYLGWPQYAMHGTNKPYGIGRRVSSGCIRLYPENIIQLFEMIPVGTPVQVVNQPIKLAWIDDVLYLEAHPDMDQALQMEETGQVYTAKMTDADMKQILAAAGEYKEGLHWSAIRNAVRDRTGVPVMIARKPGGKINDDFEVIDGHDVNLTEGIAYDPSSQLLDADTDMPVAEKQDEERKAEAVHSDVSKQPDVELEKKYELQVKPSVKPKAKDKLSEEDKVDPEAVEEAMQKTSAAAQRSISNTLNP